MAITQERVMAIIAAGLDYQQAMQRAEIIIQQASLDDAKAELMRLQALIFEAGLLKKPAQSIKILAVEESHFRKSHTANEHRRLKQRQRRRDKGTKPRDTAPQSLMTLDEITGTRHSDIVEQNYGARDQVAELRVQFAHMPASDFAKVVQQAEIDSKAARAKAEAEAKAQETSHQYSAFDPPDEEDDGSPLVPIPEG